MNYTQAPNPILIETPTGKVDQNADLSYNLGDGEVTINRNTSNFVGVPPDTSVLAKIIPIHNSNAIGISSLVYNDNTKDVTFFSKKSYSVLAD